MSKRKILEEMNGHVIRFGDAIFSIQSDSSAVGLVKIKSHNWSSLSEVTQDSFFYLPNEVHLVDGSLSETIADEQLRNLGGKLTGKNIQLVFELDNDCFFETHKCQVVDFCKYYFSSIEGADRPYLAIELDTPIPKNKFLESTNGRNWQVFGDHNVNEFCFANDDEILGELELNEYCRNYPNVYKNIDQTNSIMLSRTDDQCFISFIRKKDDSSEVAFDTWNNSSYGDEEELTNFLELTILKRNVLPIEQGFNRMNEILQIFLQNPEAVEESKHWRKVE